MVLLTVLIAAILFAVWCALRLSGYESREEEREIE